MSDQRFTVHRFEKKIPTFGIEVPLFIFSDVHRHAHNCDVHRWKKFLDFAKRKLDETEGNCLFLGLGDYDDLASTSERKILRSGLHDTTLQSMDDLMEEKTLELAHELFFMKGNLIGLIEGNHYYEFQSGETSTMRMCEALNTKYLGGASIIRLAFRHATRDNAVITLDIYAHHTAGGKGGGGRRVGSSINKIEDMSHVWFCDIYAAGHDHKMNASHPCMMYLDQSGCIKAKEQLLVRTGSFQMGWVPDSNDYVATFNGKPNFLGAPMIILRPIREKHNGHDQLRIDKALVTGRFY